MWGMDIIMKNIFYYQTNIGRIGIAEEDNQITNVFFDTDICPKQNLGSNAYSDLKEHVGSNEVAASKECSGSKEVTASKKCSSPNEAAKQNDYYIQETAILREASSQLYDYLLGKRQIFSLPLAPIGTAFMQKVWSRLCDIPYGKTKSYKEIAQAVGNEKA